MGSKCAFDMGAPSTCARVAAALTPSVQAMGAPKPSGEFKPLRVDVASGRHVDVPHALPQVEARGRHRASRDFTDRRDLGLVDFQSQCMRRPHHGSSHRGWDSQTKAYVGTRGERGMGHSSA